MTRIPQKNSTPLIDWFKFRAFEPRFDFRRDDFWRLLCGAAAYGGGTSRSPKCVAKTFVSASDEGAPSAADY
jgi:hypothetical protein